MAAMAACRNMNASNGSAESVFFTPVVSHLLCTALCFFNGFCRSGAPQGGHFFNFSDVIRYNSCKENRMGGCYVFVLESVSS